MLNKAWGYVTAAFAVVIGLFLMERGKRKEAEVDAMNAETKAKDNVLKDQQEFSLDNIAAQEKAILEAKEKHDKETTPSLAPGEAVDFWKNKGSS